MAETTKSKALEIVVDDGAQRVPIKNTYGDEIGVFYFRPTDFGIIQRYNNLVDKLEGIVEPLSRINIASDGTAAEDNTNEDVNALAEAEARLFEACDELFGGNMSEAFFGSMHPFSPVGGEFYCEKALTAVGAFITAQFDDEVKAIKRRVGRYTDKFGKRPRK